MLDGDITALKKWFLHNARDLPWRGNPSPYAVWVSEVMLQQTQVSVVIPYFLRWMDQFPTIEALAAAPEEKVLKLWEGLGYYSRARNLHQGAKQVMKDFEGALPSDPAKLSAIRGLGPYTVGAILSFAYRQKAAAVDGNVLRVLSRYYAIEDDITSSKTQRLLKTKAEELLPAKEPWVAAEALIELGAGICGRKPHCHACPLNQGCLARQKGIAAELPKRKERPKTTVLHRLTFAVVGEGKVLLKHVDKGSIMAGLHEFPFAEMEEAPGDPDVVGQWLCSRRLQPLEIIRMDALKHGFTRYQAFLYPFFCTVSQAVPVEGLRWFPIADAAELPFPSGHRELMRLLASFSFKYL